GCGSGARRRGAGSGRRHYLTTLEWLLDVAPAGSAGDPPATMFGPHLVPGNALVMVLTPLIDVRSVAMLANLARAGRFVVAVDTLPLGLADPAGPPTGTGHRRAWAPAGGPAPRTGSGCSSGPTSSASSARSASRWCNGAAPAASTRCCAGSPGSPCRAPPPARWA